MAAVDGYALALYGTDRFGTSYPAHLWAWGYGQMSALYSYLCIPFFKVLGLSRFSMRLPMLCVSLLMLPVVWDLARRLRRTVFCAARFILGMHQPLADDAEPLGAGLQPDGALPASGRLPARDRNKVASRLGTLSRDGPVGALHVLLRRSDLLDTRAVAPRRGISALSKARHLARRCFSAPRFGC